MVVAPLSCDNGTMAEACCVDVGDGFLGTFTNVSTVMPGGARCALLGCGTKVSLRGRVVYTYVYIIPEMNTIRHQHGCSYKCTTLQ